MIQLTDKQKRWLKFAIKVVITSLALYYVFRKINLQEFTAVLAGSNWGYILLSVLAFNISKIIAAFRVNELYSVAGIRLPTAYNLKLYYLGMFYNLFLPGSVGGDGYKVYLLSQNSTAKPKSLIIASLLDRLSGMTFLVILGGLFLLLSSFQTEWTYYHLTIITGMVLVLPGFYLFIRLFFKPFIKTFPIISGLSLLVQIGQALSAYFIVLALGLQEQTMIYLAIFMLASAVSVIPAFLGGLGARESVFEFVAPYTMIVTEAGVALSLLFFGGMAITALIGLLFVYKIDTINPSTGKSV